MLRNLMAASLAVVLTTGGAFAQDAGVTKLTLEDMALNAHPQFDGVSAAMMTGAFSEEGLYAANSVMRQGAVFPPHSHPDQRLTVVVSGTMYLGVGDAIDPANEQAFEAGSVALTPPGTMHYMISRDGDVRVIEIGAGPSATVFSD